LLLSGDLRFAALSPGTVVHGTGAADGQLPG